MFIYEFLIRVYFLVVFLCSPFSKKAQLWIDGRKNWREKINNNIFKNGNCIWIHCSSYGEFNDGKSLIEGIKRKYPHYKILLTFFSPSGYELSKNYSLADYIMYMPLDTKTNVRYFLKCVNPGLIFFVRHDIWPNYLSEIFKKKIPVFLYSFTLSRKSNFLKFPQRIYYRKIFNYFNAVFVHDETSKILLEKNKLNSNVVFSGNSRIDCTVETCNEKFYDEKIEKFINGKFCIIAGSTHIKDRKIFLQSYCSYFNENIKWIIAPHEINEDEIIKANSFFNEKMVRYSTSTFNENANLLWIDKAGFLSKIYRYANVVFIGGGFNRAGIHSILEPMAYGCPVCFGPNHRNYFEAINAIGFGGAKIIYNEKDLSNFIFHFKSDKQYLNNVIEKNKYFINKNAGATKRALKCLEKNNFFN